MRLSEMNTYQKEKFNELRKMLKRGVIPASLVSASIINAHSDQSPDVAKISHASQEVSLDALIINYAVNGVQARKAFNSAVLQGQPKSDVIEDVEQTVDEARLHSMLDAHEDSAT